MQRNAVLSIALLVSVAVVAGCVGQIPGLPGFGSEVIKPTVTTIVTGVTDVVAIEGVQTLPSGSILPDQSVRLFMNIVSKDTDPLKPVKNTVVQLYDASVFKNPRTNQLCNVVGCQPDSPLSPTLQAGETKSIVFSLKAPTTAEIANIITRATLSWLVRYDYTAKTNYDILLVSEQEILRLQQLGQTLSAPVQNIQGAGPVKIDVTMPITFAMVATPGAGSTTSPDIVVSFKLRNAGSGFLKDNKIRGSEFTIEFPNIGLVVDRPSQFDACSSTAQGSIVCTSSAQGDIEFFKKETIPLQFKIRPYPLPYDVPHRTFTVKATVDYTYELRGSVTLEIKPPQTG